MSAIGWALAWAGVVWLLAVGLVLVAAVVRVMRADRQAPPLAADEVLIEPIRYPGDLSRLAPTRAVVMAWESRPRRDADEELFRRWVRAREVVRQAMPDLVAALEMQVAEARSYAAAGSPTPTGPCAHGRHEMLPVRGLGGARCCTRCGRMDATAS